MAEAAATAADTRGQGLSAFRAMTQGSVTELVMHACHPASQGRTVRPRGACKRPDTQLRYGLTTREAAFRKGSVTGLP